MTAPNVPPREVIDGAQLLHELHAAFGKYVVFPSAEAHDAAVLWSAATHGQPAWEHAPRLTLTSPEKRCGKSRLMDVAEAVCYEPLVTVNASTAAVVRSITDDPPTLMVDEADTIFGTKKAAENHEDVRGIINAGHQRNRPYVRWDITSRSRELCPTFAMVMLAAIGGLPDTIMDRAIDIRMRRRSPGEKVAPFRTRRDARRFEAFATASASGCAATSLSSSKPCPFSRSRTGPPTPGNRSSRSLILRAATGLNVQTVPAWRSPEQTQTMQPMAPGSSQTSKRSGVKTRHTSSPRRSSNGFTRSKKRHGRSGDGNANRSRSAD
jgi:hypothetical protein